LPAPPGDPPEEPPSPALLSADERLTLLFVARETLARLLVCGLMARWRLERPALCARRACFVTLVCRARNELRGCRGETRALRPLYQSVARMAVAAAIDDPRFRPVRGDELPRLEITVSVLTPPVPLCPADVEVGRHGLLICQGAAAGLLLPQVAVEWGWDRAAFLAATCTKAGLPTDAWQWPDTALFGFECEVFGEAECRGDALSGLPAPAARPPDG
jgi:AmmeMemoRadiSam system protein A